VKRFSLVALIIISFSYAIFIANLAYSTTYEIIPEKLQTGLRITIISDEEDPNRPSNIASTLNNEHLSIKLDENAIIRDISPLQHFKTFISATHLDKNNLLITLASKDFKIEANNNIIDIIDPSLKTDLKNSKEIPINNSLDNSLLINADIKDKSTIINFNLHKDVGAAAYIRGKRLWVVFDQVFTPKLQVDFSKLPISNIKQEFISSSAIVFSMELKENSKNKVLMYRSGYNWLLEFTSANINPKDLRVLSKPQAAPAPKVEIELNEQSRDPIKFIDPYIGDSMIVVPLLESANAINKRYTFIDFTIPKSIQGILINPISDNILVLSRDMHITVSGRNLNIASYIFKKRDARIDNFVTNFKLDEFITESNTLLNIKSYKVSDDNFSHQVQQFRNAINNAVTNEQIVKIYTNWAIFYLANDLYAEGLTIFKLIKKIAPDSKDDYLNQLIQAALYFMSDNYLQAYNIMRSVNIVDIPIKYRKEVRFWQAMTSYMVSGSEDFFNRVDTLPIYVSNDGGFIGEYTSPFMYKFGIAIINNKLKDRLFSDVNIVLKRLLDMNLPKHKMNIVYSYVARYYSDINQFDTAMQFWDKCINDIEDNFNRVNCRFEKAKYLYETNRTIIDEYIKELDSISYIWRGDELEIKILKSLAEAYEMKKEYIKALRTWKLITNYYSFSPDALILSEKMSTIFQRFFLGGLDKTLSHFEALTLFYEFKELLPHGGKGDDIVLNLVDHLVALDLLNQAIAILTHQVNNRLAGVKREEVLNKLIKLLISNQQSDLAVEMILKGDPLEYLPDNIANERKYLKAEALIENDQSSIALSLLENDLSLQSDFLKCKVYWQSKNWKMFNKFAEPRIYQIRNFPNLLTPTDSELVTKLAISYINLEESTLFASLFNDFKDRFNDTDRNKKIFTILGETWFSSQNKINPDSNFQSKVEELLKLL
jgi:tetratricopeptide (TPR) repeat protein